MEVTGSYKLAFWGKLIGSFSFKTRPFCAVSVCVHVSMLRWSCKNIWYLISHFSCRDSAVEDSLCIWEWSQLSFPDKKRKDCIRVNWFQTESLLWTDVLLPVSQGIPSSRAPEHSKHWLVDWRWWRRGLIKLKKMITFIIWVSDWENSLEQDPVAPLTKKKKKTTRKTTRAS